MNSPSQALNPQHQFTVHQLTTMPKSGEITGTIKAAEKGISKREIIRMTKPDQVIV
jgi:hypothetical protein